MAKAFRAPRSRRRRHHPRHSRRLPHHGTFGARASRARRFRPRSSRCSLSNECGHIPSASARRHAGFATVLPVHEIHVRDAVRLDFGRTCVVALRLVGAQQEAIAAAVIVGNAAGARGTIRVALATFEPAVAALEGEALECRVAHEAVCVLGARGPNAVLLRFCQPIAIFTSAGEEASEHGKECDDGDRAIAH